MFVHKQIIVIMKGGIAMPAAIAIDRSSLVVDDALVQKYLDRVDRFVRNVDRFQEQLRSMTGAVKERLTPTQTVRSDIEHQKPEPAAAVESATITPDEIDIDALLSGVNLDGVTL